MVIISKTIANVEILSNMHAYETSMYSNSRLDNYNDKNSENPYHINENGIIVKFSGDPTNLVIPVLKINLEEYKINDYFKYGDYIYKVISNDTAICTESVEIPKIFKKELITDPVEDRVIYKTYSLNQEVLNNWYNNQDLKITKIDVPSYEEKDNHNLLEENIIKLVIEYWYNKYVSYNKKYEEKDYVPPKIEEISYDKDGVLNLYIEEMLCEFIENINYNFTDEQIALYMLKRNKELSFSDNLESLSEDKKELLNKEILVIKPITNYIRKYIESNKKYQEYIETYINKKNSHVKGL